MAVGRGITRMSNTHCDFPQVSEAAASLCALLCHNHLSPCSILPVGLGNPWLGPGLGVASSAAPAAGPAADADDSLRLEGWVLQRPDQSMTKTRHRITELYFLANVPSSDFERFLLLR